MKRSHLISIAVAIFVLPLSALADDHGNSLGTATNWTTPNIAGNLEVANDLDWFKITVTQAERIWFYTTGPTDTDGFLYDAAGNNVTPNTAPDNGGFGSNFWLTAKFQPGIYYLLVRSGASGVLTGAYTLSRRSASNALPFSTPNRVAALEVGGDMDLYRIDLPRDDRIWLYSTGNTDTDGFLFDAAGNGITPNTAPDDAGAGYNFRFTGKYAAGTYYLAVTSTSKSSGAGPLTGGYTLSFCSTETALYFQGANRESSLSVPGDLDLYRIDVARTGPVWMYSTGNTDTYATLYNHAGNDVTPNTAPDNSGADDNFLFAAVLTPNRYYLLVEAGLNGSRTGDYTLSIRDASRATALVSGGATSHSVGVLGDLDLFLFSTSGGSAAFFSTGTTDTLARIYNTAGNDVTPNTAPDNAGAGNNFSMSTNLIAGDYYLLVQGQDIDRVTGNYGLDATFVSGSLTQLSSPSVVVGAQRTGEIEVTSNTSWSVGGLPSWITSSSGSGTGSGRVTLTYSPNLSGATREAVITIGGQSYTIVQRAEGDLTGSAVPAQLSLAFGIIITVPTSVGIQYRIEASTDMSRWEETGVVLQGDGGPQNVAFAKIEARAFYRAVPQ